MKFTPILPKIKHKKGNHHGAHTEIDPAVLIQRSHTGVDKGKAGLAFAPGREPIQIGHVRPQSVIGVVEIFELNAWFVFKFLDEVAMPMLAT
jgi:hypothetical protein